ncbi:MAG: heavy-metal-associated domain-containing protein [Clostridiales bacterium]|nr:heavy-metal-associated domain-containing protein [Clostridiales bacterium]
MKKIYRVENLECANCAAKMEREIAKLDGVLSASVSFISQKITLELDDGANVEESVKKICKKIEPDMRFK